MLKRHMWQIVRSFLSSRMNVLGSKGFDVAQHQCLDADASVSFHWWRMAWLFVVLCFSRPVFGGNGLGQDFFSRSCVCNPSTWILTRENPINLASLNIILSWICHIFMYLGPKIVYRNLFQHSWSCWSIRITSADGSVSLMRVNSNY